MELFRIKKDIPFMSYGRLTTTISLITFIIAIIFLGLRGLNLGVDFTGGTLMEVSYSHPADIDKIRQVMDKIDLKDATVQNFGTSKDVLIRLPIRQDLSIAQLSEKVSMALLESDKDTKIQRVESVGSQVGEELYANGAL
ncbi:MAG: Protein translocase subunit SecF, partial [Pseudomonadota bacterium]